MNLALTRDLTIFSFLLVVLAALFLYGRSLDIGQEQLIAPNIRTIIANDARINENIALLRTGLHDEYDQLNHHLNEIHLDIARIEAQLLDVSITGIDLLIKHVRALRAKVDEKEVLVERFKSMNAILRNSTMFIALTSSQISDQPTLYQDILNATGRLSILLVRFYRQHDEEVATAIRKQLALLRRLSTSPTVLHKVNQLEKHVNLMVTYTPAIELAMAEISTVNIRDSAEAVMQEYLRLFFAHQAKAKVYRWSVYAASIFLLGYATFILWRLRTNRRELVRVNRELSFEKDRAKSTLHSIGEGVMTVTHEGFVEYMNPVAERLTNWTAAEASGQHVRHVLQLLVAETNQMLPANYIDSLTRGSIESSVRDDLILRARGNTEHRIEISAFPITSVSDQPEGAVLIFRDTTETRRLIDRISHQAKHDSLTGLVNRWEFERRLKNLLFETSGVDEIHALCYIDLDQFKVINDTCGHMAGDELLRQLARVLSARVRTADTLARLGGDEFGVLLMDCPISRAMQIAEQLRQEVQDYEFIWEGNRFSVGASVGLVPLGRETNDAQQVLTHADLACYAAKDLGRNRVHVYTHGDFALARRQQEMIWANDIRQALDEDRLRLYAQPIVSAREKRGKVDHYEVLVRFVTPTGDEILPGDFIPAAERFGVMASVDRWVIDRTFDWLAKHQSSEHISLCINLSGTSLGEPLLPGYIEERMRAHGIDARQIFFEITETAAVANVSEAVSLIERLRAQGFRFLLDDFGSGLSSFNYLRTLPVDYLKIDGHIVRQVANDPVYRAMVESINHVGHVMGKRTIAEFVENDNIRTELEKLGVDFLQGYAIGPPISLSTLIL